ncbi:MAG: DNA double-strand break repair nuclease NurA [Candidatus Omnitrophica bacterium]|nr:DNA double-strand break repair nuclease NurA [Candidatus Omnitrophota bacterium]MBI2674852.1 DNA double-strand break repair nuclease NurA [Candidatus Aenigmarchaeota archaeon]
MTTNSFEAKIRKIAERVAETESKKERISDFLKSISKEIDLKMDVQKDALADTRIVAVDGGLLKKSLHSFDCILYRSAAVCFNYKKGRMAGVSYYPSKAPYSKPEVFESLSDLDFGYIANIERMHDEIRTAIKSIEVFEPDILLLDGSIMPHYTSKPARSSPVFEKYEELIESINSLCRICSEEKVTLAGVIEDSRSNSFCSMLAKTLFSKITHRMAGEAMNVLANSRDTNILFHFLKKGEATRPFRTSDDPESHHILKDLEGFGEEMHYCYLKTSVYDRPIKVEFIRREEAAKIANILLAVSGHHPSYGFPSPLIEADNVARLKEEEMERLYSHLSSILGRRSSFMKLRREERPF